MKRPGTRWISQWRELPLIESLFVAAFLCLLAIALLSAASLTQKAAAGRVSVVQMTR